MKPEHRELERRKAEEQNTKPPKVGEGEVQLVYESGRPYGIRDTNGFLFFFAPIQKYLGQEERYQEEVKQQFRLATRLLASLTAEEAEQPKAEVQSGLPTRFSEGELGTFVEDANGRWMHLGEVMDYIDDKNRQVAELKAENERLKAEKEKRYDENC